MLLACGWAGAGAVLGLQQLHSHTRSEREPTRRHLPLAALDTLRCGPFWRLITLDLILTPLYSAVQTHSMLRPDYCAGAAPLSPGLCRLGASD